MKSHERMASRFFPVPFFSGLRVNFHQCHAASAITHLLQQKRQHKSHSRPVSISLLLGQNLAQHPQRSGNSRH
jgi:hypothetical protein